MAGTGTGIDIICLNFVNRGSHADEFDRVRVHSASFRQRGFVLSVLFTLPPSLSPRRRARPYAAFKREKTNAKIALAL